MTSSILSGRRSVSSNKVKKLRNFYFDVEVEEVKEARNFYLFKLRREMKRTEGDLPISGTLQVRSSLEVTLV